MRARSPAAEATVSPDTPHATEAHQKVLSGLKDLVGAARATITTTGGGGGGGSSGDGGRAGAGAGTGSEAKYWKLLALNYTLAEEQLALFKEHAAEQDRTSAKYIEQLRCGGILCGIYCVRGSTYNSTSAIFPVHLSFFAYGFAARSEPSVDQSLVEVEQVSLFSRVSLNVLLRFLGESVLVLTACLTAQQVLRVVLSCVAFSLGGLHHPPPHIRQICSSARGRGHGETCPRGTCFLRAQEREHKGPGPFDWSSDSTEAYVSMMDRLILLVDEDMDALDHEKITAVKKSRNLKDIFLEKRGGVHGYKVLALLRVRDVGANDSLVSSYKYSS